MKDINAVIERADRAIEAAKEDLGKSKKYWLCSVCKVNKVYLRNKERACYSCLKEKKKSGG